MTTRIHSAGPRANVQDDHTAARVTPPVARPFRSVLAAGASAVVSGAESATRQLPGGPILAAAFRSAPQEATTSAADPEGPTGTSGGGALGPLGLGGAESSGAGGGASALSREGDQTLYYLELQQQISAESNAYTALSNVLKARHDTIKNAIGNIR